ncbi:MAG: helix-turn-helix domain-containing protein [Clostridiales bacterium]|nr:helix-turn-helix domain-containing protein [Clostridiales bacterium]
MTIGQRIKELRKKQNLTQEKLADLLGVSFQAVSKWENDMNAPDLSLIAPLTRLLHVTADELLGLTEEQNDERLAYFEEQYIDFWKRSDHEADLELAKQAAAEYPQNARFQNWLASDEFYTAYDSDYISGGSKEHFTRNLESSLKHYLMSYELADEVKTKYSALHGIVLNLTLLDRFDEARQYAELMPEEANSSRDDLIVMTLKGEEKRTYRQGMVLAAFRKFLGQLYSLWTFDEDDPDKSTALREACAAMIETAIPDGNYLFFVTYIYDMWMGRAYQAVRKGDADRAIHNLYEAKKSAEANDRLKRTDTRERFTCPMFDTLDYNGKDPNYEFDYLDFLDYWRKELEDECFDAIRSEPAFQALLRDPA